jgi:hypothetical protein
LEKRALLQLEQVLTFPVRSLAVGRPRVAVLGDDPWWNDGGRFKAIPLPQSMRAHDGEQEFVNVFFGRDDRLRIMGHRTDASNTKRPVYLRHLRTGWVREKAEQARLAGAPEAPLFGVLGHDDPEVLCKVGDACLIKRTTGWQTLTETLGWSRVAVARGGAWAYRDDAMFELTDGGFKAIDLPAGTRSLGGVWGVPGQVIVATDPSAGRILRRANGAWLTEPSPVEAPLGIWGASTDSLWVVGESGAAFHDGRRWFLVEGLPRGLTHVLGSSHGDVWFAGKSGLWRGTRASSAETP